MIKARRTAKGLTQQQLAEQIGVSRSIVNKWESDERVASGPSIRGLERVLGNPSDTQGLLVDEASDVELLTVLLNRRLAADRAAGATPTTLRPALPKEDLEWPDEEGDGGSGESHVIT